MRKANKPIEERRKAVLDHMVSCREGSPLSKLVDFVDTEFDQAIANLRKFEDDSKKSTLVFK